MTTVIMESSLFLNNEFIKLLMSLGQNWLKISNHTKWKKIYIEYKGLVILGGALKIYIIWLNI